MAMPIILKLTAQVALQAIVILVAALLIIGSGITLIAWADGAGVRFRSRTPRWVGWC